MSRRMIDVTMLKDFEKHLIEEEKADSTIKKYIRDVKALEAFADGRELSKELLIAYKGYLIESNYAVKSINSMLVSLRMFFLFMNWDGLNVKMLKVQQQVFADENSLITREEYIRLCIAAEKKGDFRISLIMQTICSTGIRVGELKYIDVEAVQTGIAVITLKGKTRTVFLPSSLQEKLKVYIARTGKESGEVFTTSSGLPVDRYSVWKGMKALGKDADVEESKIYPHNLRHLFAREFYRQENDIVQLADILGHSSIETTRIYMMSTGNEHRRKINRMNLVI